MNIAMKGAGLLGMGNPGLKSTQDRLDRMAKRDNKIAQSDHHNHEAFPIFWRYLQANPSS